MFLSEFAAYGAEKCGGSTVKQKPIEVAVIGEGCASLAAAFELTRPEHTPHFPNLSFAWTTTV